MPNSNIQDDFDVVFKLSGDALKPSQAPWGFVARNPVQRVIEPNGSITVNMLIGANVPMLVFPMRQHLNTVEVTSQFLLPGQTLQVNIHNKSTISMVVDDKEGLVGLHPLMFDGSWSAH